MNRSHIPRIPPLSQLKDDLVLVAFAAVSAFVAFNAGLLTNGF